MLCNHTYSAISFCFPSADCDNKLATYFHSNMNLKKKTLSRTSYTEQIAIAHKVFVLKNQMIYFKTGFTMITQINKTEEKNNYEGITNSLQVFQRFPAHFIVVFHAQFTDTSWIYKNCLDLFTFFFK